MIQVPTDEEFQDALNAPSEKRDIEFKCAMNLSEKEHIAKFAMHVCAISNYGGGFIIFGRKNEGGFIEKIPSEFADITTERVNEISKNYLFPPPECTVKRLKIDESEMEFPVVYIPPLDTIPVMGIEDGPRDRKGRIIGIEKSVIFTRSTQPQSIKVKPRDLHLLLDKLFKRLISCFNPLLNSFGLDSTILIGEILRIYSIDDIDLLLENYRKPPQTQENLPPKNEMTSHRFSGQIASREIALIALIGSWNENSEEDIRVFSKLLKLNYRDDWLPMASEILHKTNLPISVKNGIWTVTDNISLLQEYGTGVLDQNLDDFKSIVNTVLCELDPIFDLPIEQRWEAQIHGKITKFSGALRKGISQGLAILNNHPEYFENCSFQKVRDYPMLVVRKLLERADWRLWGSLNHLLPTLAEASPNEFLKCVRSALQLDPCPFDEIFKQEGDEFGGGSHIVGLLWALETLAWDEKYLVESIYLLADLASHDPGGYWSNRPSESIETILTPWLPRTLAGAEKRFASMKTILKEFPEIGWKSLLKMLPNQITTSTDTRKPKWIISVPEDYKVSISNIEYNDQITFYSNLALENTISNINRITNLIEILDVLPSTTFENLLLTLSSSLIREDYSNDCRKTIWEALVKIANKHRQFQHTDWALSEEKITQIESLIEQFVPSDPYLRYQILFSGRDINLVKSRRKWGEQSNILEKERKIAIQELLDTKGIDQVINFSKEVTYPNKVGRALGNIANQKIDNYLIPKILSEENEENQSFIEYYIRERLHLQNWSWVDNILNSIDNLDQILKFLLKLPCEMQTWKRVVKLLKENESMYWEKVADTISIPETDIEYAIDKFIQFERPRAAISCFNMLRDRDKQFDKKKCILALEKGINSNEPPGSFLNHEISELISYLQETLGDSKEELVRIEFAYHSLLDGYSGAKPRVLEHKLSTDPEFFCEMLNMVYKSSNENKEIQEEPPIDKKYVTTGWNLLLDWKTVPGTTYDDKFDPVSFKNWFKSVKDITSESGYLEIALDTIGRVLIYAPEDPDGLWINRTIADVLNERENDVLRESYRVAELNSRGTHIVEPSGLQEEELANKYRNKVAELESANYHNFAVTIQKIVDRYEREAEETRNRWNE